MNDRVNIFTLYYYNMKTAIAQCMQFRADFAIGVVSSFFFSIIGPICQYLIFRLTRGYPGWTIAQMIVFQGVFVLWTGIQETFFGGVRFFIRRTIRKGDFDRILLKPVNSAGFILASGFSFQSAGSIIAGIAVLIIAVPVSGSTVTLPAFLIFLGIIPCAALLYMALTLLFCSITVIGIFTGRLGELLDRLLDFSAYPAEIYPAPARLVYEIIVPFAIFIHFPARALLGQINLIMACGAVSAIILFFVSLWFWYYTVKRYTSAGG